MDWLLFADGVGVDAGVLGWVSTVVSLGFSVWFGVHTVRVTIPNMTTANNLLVEKLVSDFREEMRLEREQHAEELSEQRAECRRENEQLIAVYTKHIQLITKEGKTIAS